jgi:hypothetical protein
MTVPRLAFALSTAACFLAAQSKPALKVQSVATTHVDFPAGATLHVERSIGELTIEGWDGPGMEMTVTKAPPLNYDARWNAEPARDQALEKVKITAGRQGNEVFVRTVAPRIRHVWVTYRIRVPRSAALVIDHQGGEVHVVDIAGDIRATTRQGEIALLLPPDEHYAIDARTKFGDVYSDYPGAERRRFWLVGHRFAPEGASEGHKLYLRAGYGDIIIQKIRRPSYPSPRP